MTNRCAGFLRLLVLLLGLLLLAPVAPVHASQKPAPQVTQERENARYQVGETVTFTIRTLDGEGGPAREAMGMQISLNENHGAALVETQTLQVTGEPITISHTFTRPGFVTLTAIGRSWQGERIYERRESTVACEPEKIEPVVQMPDDFDAFWANARASLAQDPLDVQQEHLPDLSDEHQNTYKISFASVDGKRVHGYLLVPTSGRSDYPAFVAVAPAGVNRPLPSFVGGRLNNLSKNQAVCLFMGVYDHELGLPQEYYRENSDQWGGPRDLAERAEDYFFYSPILGIDRAITWLANRDDVDSSRVVFTGGSQGGGMGLILTGLNEHITAASIHIPALCDHVGFLQGRANGWPGLLSDRWRRSMTPEQVETMTQILPYFDAVNFSRRIDVPVIFHMGYQDTTCPPSSVYAAFNVIDGPKTMVEDPYVGHGIRGDNSRILQAWVREQLGIQE